MWTQYAAYGTAFTVVKHGYCDNDFLWRYIS